MYFRLKSRNCQVSTPDHVGSPTRAGRRERKKLETRERIFESGVALFAAHGYDATTMEQIGERADVSRATVFNYFARKEDIVFAWFDRMRAEFAKALAEDDQHTATLDLILPSIMRPSSVDTNGPSDRHPGKNRRTS